LSGGNVDEARLTVVFR